MSAKRYSLFCPLAMACEILEPRWTVLILVEMWCGATRFNEIKRGVPGISPTLLSKRLKEMESNGLIERIEDIAKGTVDYVRTPLAIELEPALDLLGEWAYRNIESEVALQDLNVDYLMWNVRQHVEVSELPERRVVVRFHFTDLPDDRGTYWLHMRPGFPVDLCMADPGFEVDLYIEVESKALASVWMGYSSTQSELSHDRIRLVGDSVIARTIDKWLVKISYAELNSSPKERAIPAQHALTHHS